MGTWSESGGDPSLVYNYTGPDGQTRRMGFVFKRVDDNTTKVDVYEVVGTDTLASSPEATVELKRRK